MVYWGINYLIDGVKQAGNILELDWNTKKTHRCENGMKPIALILVTILDLGVLNTGIPSEVTRAELAQNLTRKDLFLSSVNPFFF